VKKEDKSKPKRTKQDRLDNLSEMVKRAEKMGFLYKTKMLTTNIAARPFLGITTQVSQEIARTIQDRFADRTKKS
jgi:phage gpG-like protein